MSAASAPGPWASAGRFLIALIAATTVHAQQGAKPANPFVGTWTINFSKSQLHPNYQIKASTLSVAVAGADVTLTNDVVLASGQQQKQAETFYTDGRERPGSHTPGVILLARWVGSHTLETRVKKDGQEIAMGIYEVSADGKTLTATMSGPAALEMVAVFDRK